MSNAKKSFWKSRTFFVLLSLIAAPPLLFVLLVVWVVIPVLLPNPPLVISEETTRVTGPLTNKGYIDFFKALEERYYPPELTTDENGFRIFVRQFGDGGYSHDVTPEDREFYRRQVYEKLELNLDVPPTMTLLLPPGEIVEDFDYGQPWTLEDYPMLADWVNEMDEPLDALAEMIRKPVFYPPLLQSPESVKSGKPQLLVSIILPDGLLFRNIGRVFAARAAYRIGQGNIDGAIEDKLTVHRLGRLTTQRGFLTQYLVGIAIENMAVAIPISANSEHSITQEQIQRVFERFDALPQRGSFRETLEWDRYTGLSAIQDVQIEGSSRRTLNWNIIYRRMNDMYDAILQPPPQTEYAAILTEIDEASDLTPWKRLAWMMTPYSREKAMTHMFIALMIPAVDAILEATRRTECAENMQRLVLAIKLYQLDNRTLPDGNWAEQIAKYLGENPEQYFSCPSNPSVNGETTYALVQYGDNVPEHYEAILLVELKVPVPLDKAVITVDEVLALPKNYDYDWKSNPSPHSDGMNTARRSGAVVFLSMGVSESELSHLLGRSEK